MRCTFCESIVLPVPTNAQNPEKWTWSRIKHHPSVSSLRESARAGCDLCRFFDETLEIEYNDHFESTGQVTFSWACNKHGVIGNTYLLFDLLQEERFDDEGMQIEYLCIDLELFDFEATFEPRTTGRIPALHSGSAQCLDWARQKLLDCDTDSNHSECHESRSPDSTRPRRLLDLDLGDGSEDLRLADGARSGAEPYVCLSHRWGDGPRPLTTTLVSISTHSLRIELQRLPKSLQDAVRICRHLNIRWLWVCTLCILQDSHEDWVLESVKMGSYYEHAYLTLALDCVNGSQYPVLQDRDPVPYARLGGDLSSIGIRSEKDHAVDRFAGGTSGTRCHRFSSDCIENGSPLGHRGWTFQERALSKRILHFARSQLVWECACHILVECDTRSLGAKFSFLRQLTALENTDNDTTDTTDRAFRMYLWQIEAYNHRALKEPQDRLTAFQGVTQAFAPFFESDTFALGLWTSHIPQMLYFERRHASAGRFESKSDGTPKDGRVAPTWSWASRCGHITFQWPSRASPQHLLNIISYTMELTNPQDPYGSLGTGRLTIAGQCSDIQVPDTFREYDQIFVRTINESLLGILVHDIEGYALELAVAQKLRMQTATTQLYKWSEQGSFNFDDPQPDQTSYRNMVVIKSHRFAEVEDEWEVGLILLLRVDAGIYHKVGILKLPAFAVDCIVWEHRTVVVE